MNRSFQRLCRPAWGCFAFATFIFIGHAQAQMGADQINMNGQYVLAAKAGKVERVGQLLRQGAAVDSRDRLGNSPLNMAAAKGNEALAKAYLEYLYTPAGQALVARYHYRPRSADVLAKEAAQFPKIELLTLEQVAGDWKQANAKHFADGGSFDQIYAK